MRWLTLSAVLGFAGFNAGLAQSPASKIAPQKGWHTDLEVARALGKKTGKPLMVVFRCDP